MNINSSLDFKKISGSSINSLAGHTTRNEKYVNNDNVDFNQSKYNIYWNMGNAQAIGQQNGTTHDMKKLIKRLDYQHWHSTWAARNAKLSKQHRKSRMVSFAKYMKSPRRSNPNRLKIVVATLGKGSRAKLDTMIADKYPKVSLNQLHIREQKAYSRALANYGKEWNDSHKFVKCVGFSTNVDEVKEYKNSSPHLHMVLYANGHTKSGKPSTNMSTAIKCETGMRNYKKALSAFAKANSKALVKATNKVFTKRFNHCNFNLKWTPNHQKHNGIPMDEYKQIMSYRRHYRTSLSARIDKEQAKNLNLQESNNNLKAKASYWTKSATSKVSYANSQSLSVASATATFSSASNALSSLFNAKVDRWEHTKDLEASQIADNIGKGSSYVAQTSKVVSQTTSKAATIMSQTKAHLSQASTADLNAQTNSLNAKRELIHSNHHLARVNEDISNKEARAEELNGIINYRQHYLGQLREQISQVKDEYNTYKVKFKNFTNNLIMATNRTLRQNATSGERTYQQLKSANNATLGKANHSLFTTASNSSKGLFGGIADTIRTWGNPRNWKSIKSNYQSIKASKANSTATDEKIANHDFNLSDNQKSYHARQQFLYDTNNASEAEHMPRPTLASLKSSVSSTYSGATLKYYHIHLASSVARSKAQSQAQSRVISLANSRASLSEARSSVSSKRARMSSLSKAFARSDKESRAVNYALNRNYAGWKLTHPEQYQSELANQQSPGQSPQRN